MVNHTVTGYTNHFSLYATSAQDWNSAKMPTLDGFQVSSFTGAGTYSYPLEVPTGPGGLQPSLSFSYNSQAVDRATSYTQASQVGMGWSFDQGYIERNMHGSNDFLNDDTFNLTVNGVSSRLLPIGGDPDNNPNTDDYRLADENYWRVRHYKATGWNGYQEDQSSWVVWDTVGNQYYFGERGYSNCVGHWCDGDRAHYPRNNEYVPFLETWKWSLSRIRNIHGQNLNFYYRIHRVSKTIFKEYSTFADNEVMINQIVYPNNRYRVRFVWSDRTDLNWDWAENASSFVLFSSHKLSEIVMEYLPPETTTNWAQVRKYALTYATDADLPNIPFPYVDWSGAHTLTLKSIQEFGASGTGLRPTTFTYGDSMHLTKVDNGYGGRIELSYSPWHDQDTLEYTDVWVNDNSWFEIQNINTLNPKFYGLLKGYSPGQYYKVKLHIRPTATSFCLQYNYFGENNYNTQCFPVAQPGIYIFQTDTNHLHPATAERFNLWVICNPNLNCKMDYTYVATLPTYYRVSSKRIFDGINATPQTFTYSYEGAAMNTTNNSAVLAANPGCLDVDLANGDCYERPYTEFRGHSKVTETGPDGKVTITYFHQDDILKGKPSKIEVKNGNTLYSETVISYASLDRPVVAVYPDLKSRWVYTTSTIMRSYEGGSTWLGSKTEYIYDNNLGGNYGNLTNQVEYVWNGANWTGVRYSRIRYIPNVSNNLNLVGLPAYEAWSKCNYGNCDLENSPSDLLGQTVFIYDANTRYDQPPTSGMLSAKRVMLSKDSGAWTNQKFSDEKYTFDAWGNRVGVTVYTGEGTNDATGAVQFTGSPRVSTTAYDPIYHTYPVAHTDAAGQTSTVNYNYRLGVPIAETGINGVASLTTAEYDEFGRILRVYKPGDSSPSFQVSYHDTYPFWTEAQQLITGSTYYKVRKFYDGMGRLIQTQKVNVEVDGAAGKDIIVNATYDAYGRVKTQSVPYAVPTGSGYRAPDPGQPKTTTNYDILGRPVSILAPNQATQTFSYAIELINSTLALKAITTDANGHASVQYMDAMGQLIISQPATGPAVTYEYDPKGQLVEANYGLATTTLNYDLAGRKTSMTDADMGAWSYTYTALGNLLSQTDARGCVTGLNYDALNRLTGKTYTNCPTTSPPTYTYGTEAVTRTDDFSETALPSGWTQSGSSATVTGENLRITGTGPWQAAYRTENQAQNKIFRFQFRLLGTGHNGRIFIESGTSGSSDYRRWGLSFSGTSLDLQRMEGTTILLSNLMPLNTDIWYELTMEVKDGDRFRILVRNISTGAVAAEKFEYLPGYKYMPD